MFSLFKTPSFHDPLLGDFARSRGCWRGSLLLDGVGNVPLVLSGRRTEPDATAIAAARTLANAFNSWRSVIESALFEHYSHYAEALAAADLPPPTSPLPEIKTRSQIWLHVSMTFVSVTPLEGVLTSEFGYTTAWDEEHTLGARFQEGEFLELCGSVLPP
jgi:hypothetical protein